MAHADNNDSTRVSYFFRSPLFWSTTANVLIVNVFAVYYTLSLGPERRAYLATIFAITLILHTVLVQGPGLSLRRLAPMSHQQAIKNLNSLVFGCFLSTPIFLFLLSAYSYVQKSFPLALFISSLFYFISSIILFVINELILYQRSFTKLVLNEILCAISLPFSFSLSVYIFGWTPAVSVLFAFSASYVLVILVNCKSILMLKQEMNFKIHLSPLGRYKSNQSRDQNFSPITIFNSGLERLDKVILAFAIDPTLFAKFTFNIAPFLVLRYIPSLFSKVTVAKKLPRDLSVVGFSVILLSGTLIGLVTVKVLQDLQGGIWFIGLTPIIAFALYESFRVFYALVLAQDIANSNHLSHHTISKMGLFSFPVLFFICLILSNDNLAFSYLTSSIFLFCVLTWNRYSKSSKVRYTKTP